MPRYAVGPDGTPLSESDLPSPETKRWFARHKALVVTAVNQGLLSLDEALERYNLTLDEFLPWQRNYAKGGQKALRATKIQQYRS